MPKNWELGGELQHILSLAPIQEQQRPLLPPLITASQGIEKLPHHLLYSYMVRNSEDFSIQEKEKLLEIAMLYSQGSLLSQGQASNISDEIK